MNFKVGDRIKAITNIGVSTIDRDFKIKGEVGIIIGISKDDKIYKVNFGNLKCNLWVPKDEIVLAEEDKPQIKIKYFNNDLKKINKISIGDWIDLRAAETIEMKQGEFKLIPLGIAIQLPKGYEANVVPRSSTFKNFGVIQTNSVGVIDESYCGDNDQWFFPAYALRDTTINFNDRICQFRIQKKMPKIEFIETDVLKNKDRGGHGSTGIK